MHAHYVPNVMQMGFQAKLGTEVAIIAQTVQTMKGGQKWTAVLDLKSAYDAVRRDLIFERCAKVQPNHTTAMISYTLQNVTVTTAGDDTKTEAKIDSGVTQGRPASPTLFNIFVDSLANALEKHLWNPDGELLAHLYADDVILHVKSMLDLQRALIICERWAPKCGMRWALSKWKREVLLPSELALQYKAFPFVGGQITTVTEARYLGVVLSANGILECGLKNRIQMWHASLSTLRNAKLIFSGVDPSYAKMVYRTLIESKMDFATFLCPSSADALHAFDSLLRRFFQSYLGIRVRQSQIPPSTSDVQYWHIWYPSENVGQCLCWKTNEHSGRWSCNHAAEAPSKEGPDSLELLRSIPADRTTGNETAEKRWDHVDEANYARTN